MSIHFRPLYITLFNFIYALIVTVDGRYIWCDVSRGAAYQRWTLAFWRHQTSCRTRKRGASRWVPYNLQDLNRFFSPFFGIAVHNTWLAVIVTTRVKLSVLLLWRELEVLCTFFIDGIWEIVPSRARVDLMVVLFLQPSFPIIEPILLLWMVDRSWIRVHQDPWVWWSCIWWYLGC